MKLKNKQKTFTEILRTLFWSGEIYSLQKTALLQIIRSNLFLRANFFALLAGMHYDKTVCHNQTLSIKITVKKMFSRSL